MDFGSLAGMSGMGGGGGGSSPSSSATSGIEQGGDVFNITPQPFLSTASASATSWTLYAAIGGALLVVLLLFTKK